MFHLVATSVHQHITARFLFTHMSEKLVHDLQYTNLICQIQTATVVASYLIRLFSPSRSFTQLSRSLQDFIVVFSLLFTDQC